MEILYKAKETLYGIKKGLGLRKKKKIKPLMELQARPFIKIKYI